MLGHGAASQRIDIQHAFDDSYEFIKASRNAVLHEYNLFSVVANIIRSETAMLLGLGHLCNLIRGVKWRKTLTWGGWTSGKIQTRIGTPSDRGLWPRDQNLGLF